MIQLKYTHSQKSHLLTGLVPGFSHFGNGNWVADHEIYYQLDT